MTHDHYYTTGQVATACRVAPRTVSKWCDAGLLSHVRLPDLSGKKVAGDRRIPRGPLLTFMRKHKLPLDIIGDGFVLLAVGLGAADLRRLAGPAVTLRAAAGAFEAGQSIADHGAPDAAVVDAERLGSAVASGVVRALREVRVKAVAVMRGECGSGPAGDKVFARPFDFDKLVAWVGGLADGSEPPEIPVYQPMRRYGRKGATC